MNESRARVVVVGATGYTGRELVGLLAHHAGAELVGLFGSGSREGSRPFADEFPRFRNAIDLPIEPMSPDRLCELEPDAVFLATPHEVSHSIVSERSGKDAPIIVDLSAAFRHPCAKTCRDWYAIEHTDAGLLASAVYGLVEHARDELLGADLIAAPGCYPTAALLGLRPLASAGAIAPGSHVSVIGISGVSGAGRGVGNTAQLFCEVSLRPYGVTGHRHLPEITHHLGASSDTRVVFTPHVGPWDRGMVVTSHVKLAKGWDADRVAQAFTCAYPTHSNPFVRLLDPGQLPSVAAVAGTNYCDIAWHLDESTGVLIIASAIDNLLKGASGQAVQAWNVRMGFDESQGLLPAIGPQRVAAGGAL